MAIATSSLPVPVSPWISTGTSLPLTISMFPKTLPIFSEEPTILRKFGSSRRPPSSDTGLARLPRRAMSDEISPTSFGASTGFAIQSKAPFSIAWATSFVWLRSARTTTGSAESMPRSACRTTSASGGLYMSTSAKA